MTLLLWLFLVVDRSPAIWGSLQPGTHRAGMAHVTSRDLEMTYWYPARAAGRRVLLRELASSAQAFAVEAGVDGLPEEIIRRYRDRELYATTGAKAARGRFPLILVAQGNQQQPLHQAILSEWLASHGFIVASAASTTIAAPMKSADDVGAAAQREAEQLQSILRVMAARADVDATRVAVVGHSFGARAALLLVMREPSVRTLVSLDGGIGTDQAMDSFRSAPWFSSNATAPPVLHLYETADSFMSPDFTLLKSLRTATLELRRIEHLHHVHFTTLGFAAAMDSALGQVVQLEPGSGDDLRDYPNAVLTFLQRHLR